MSKRPFVGPTGEFPRGKLNKDDEGALSIAIATDEGVVKVFFGKKVSWIGMPKAHAILFANTILERAKALPDAD